MRPVSEEARELERTLRRLPLTAQEEGAELIEHALTRARDEANSEGAQQGWNEAIRFIETLAERPYDNEPEFSCLLDVANRMRAGGIADHDIDWAKRKLRTPSTPETP